MKRQIFKNTVCFGIFSILIFTTFNVFAMNGHWHGSQSSGRSSSSDMRGHMEDNHSSRFQHMDQDMDRQIERNGNLHINRSMDQNMDQDWPQSMYHNTYQRRNDDMGQRWDGNAYQQKDYFTK